MANETSFQFVQGTPEQVEVFMDIQRMLVRLYNMWPGDTAIAVFAGAMGSVTAMIEAQYKLHLEECEHCRGSLDADLDLADVVKSNFAYYYELQHEEALRAMQSAGELVEKFFKGRMH